MKNVMKFSLNVRGVCINIEVSYEALRLIYRILLAIIMILQLIVYLVK
jgi:hypothetical protein